MTVAVYSACISTYRFDKLFNAYRHLLPAKVVEQMRQFHFEIDACRSLLGKLLLLKGLTDLGYRHIALEQLQVDDFKKPFFENGPPFNISHSGNYVVCALSTEGKLGIDVEEKTAADLTCFRNCFTNTEWGFINGTNDPSDTFYELWTKKEAVIKADGRGLYLPLLSFEVLESCIPVNDQCWHVQEVLLAPGYSSHLAFDRPVYQIHHLHQSNIQVYGSY